MLANNHLVGKLCDLYISRDSASCLAEMKKARLLIEQGWQFVHSNNIDRPHLSHRAVSQWCQRTLGAEEYYTFSHKGNYTIDYYFGFTPQAYTAYLLKWA